MGNNFSALIVGSALLGGGALSACAQEGRAAQEVLTPAEIVTAAAKGGDAFLPDFSYAGYGFGITPLPDAAGAVIDPADHGAFPNDGKDDSAGLKAALAVARDVRGPVVIRLQPGRYRLTEVLDLDRSGLVIQGAGRGEGGTEIHMPRPLEMVETGTRLDELRQYLVKYNKRQRDADDNVDVLFSEYSWTGGFLWVGRPGARAVPYLEESDERPAAHATVRAGQREGLTITTDGNPRLRPGQWVDIQWYSDSPESGIIQSIYGDTDLDIGSHHWTFKDRPLVRHRTQVTAVDGQTVRLASPLPHPIDAQTPATLSLWAPLTDVGIEDLRFTFPEAPSFGHHQERGYNAIYFTGAANGWVRNVTVENQDAGILTDDSAHLTLTNLEFRGDRMAHYAVHLGSVGNVLVKSIDVASPIVHSLTFNTKSVRSVYSDATVRRQPVIDQHAGANHQNLYDDVRLHLTAAGPNDAPAYPVFDGSGAPYWQPGHGRYNTVWNMELVVEGGMAPDETLAVQGLAEGPAARIIGLYGNREITLDYRPTPLTSHLGRPVTHIRSLYDFQLSQRARARP